MRTLALGLSLSLCACATTASTHAPTPPDATSDATSALDAGRNDTASEAATTTPTTTDAGSSDTSTGGGPDTTTGGCSSLPLCDDFESSTAGSPPSATHWKIITPDCSGTGAITVDSTQAHSGTQSVKVSGADGYCNHVFFGNDSVIGTVGTSVYVRFYVRFASTFNNGHVSFLAMKDTADGGKNLRMGGQNAALMYNRESDDATLPEQSPAGVATSKKPDINTWYCLELHVDESAGTIDTWIDGTEVAGLVENGTPVPNISAQWLTKSSWRPKLADLKLGWESYSGEAMTLWIDDVAIAGSRIGCL